MPETTLSFFSFPSPPLLLLLVDSSLKETIELLSLEKEESDEILSGDLQRDVTAVENSLK
jgi:hypothetical protein